MMSVRGAANQKVKRELARQRKTATVIERALVRMKSCSRKRASGVAFHMTDWLSDLDRYCRFCRDPKGLKPSQIEELLFDFISHVPEHVAAAKVLLTGDPVRDTFEVGAVPKARGS